MNTPEKKTNPDYKVNPKKSAQFAQRCVFSVVAIVIITILIKLSFSSFGVIFGLGLAILLCAALWEYYNIAIVKGFRPLVLPGLICAFVYIMTTYFTVKGATFSILPSLVLVLSLLFLFLYNFYYKSAQPLVNLAITLFGLAYVVIPLTCILNITYFFSSTQLQDGRYWLVYLIATTKMCDIGGYFIGKQWGTQPLAPLISPKKTVEGAVAGFFFAVITSLFMWIMAQLFFEEAFRITLWQSIWLGAIIGIVSQIGDLSESLIKRDGGVKDSNELPGVGGILDMVDSLIFTTPLVYLFLYSQII